MANIITAGNSTNGGTAITTDTSGTLNIVTGSGSGATAITVDGSQNLSFNSGYGSAAVAYGCRAWVNFNGQGTVAIRGSGNVTSITDNGTGDYTVNFTNAMPDVNYASLATTNQNAAANPTNFSIGYPDNSSTILYSTTQVRFLIKFSTSTAFDAITVSIAIFR
jgi:hypothetical protein